MECEYCGKQAEVKIKTVKQRWGSVTWYTCSLCGEHKDLECNVKIPTLRPVVGPRDDGELTPMGKTLG